jgi:hypothetical protein
MRYNTGLFPPLSTQAEVSVVVSHNIARAYLLFEKAVVIRYLCLAAYMGQVIYWLPGCLENVQEASFVVYSVVLKSKQNERSHNLDFYSKSIFARSQRKIGERTIELVV